LLETLHRKRYNITGNGKCDSQKGYEIRQSAAKHLRGNSGEGSETTVSLRYYKYYGDDPTAPCM